MSITNSARENIKNYILKHIDLKDNDLVAKTATNFNISRTSVYNYIKQLENENAIKKSENSKKYKYELVKQRHTSIYDTSTSLDEDLIFNSDIKQYLSELPKNVYGIWRHGFTEMMNNAIDHANAKKILCSVYLSKLTTEIIIIDNGVGIFNKIKDYFIEKTGEEISLDDAVMQLAAGKFTTSKLNHSGEGIFFTSKIFDEFVIYSDNKMFSRNAITQDFYKVEHGEIPYEKGTIVLMKLSNSSSKKLEAVFNEYTSVDEGFNKTQIPIATVFPDGYPVSRSEAKRLAAAISRFEEVELDFAGVENLGQGFAHELFVVFARNNPNIKLLPVNCNTTVEGMIKRVQVD